MKKTILILLVFIIAISSMNAQEIQSTKVFGGYKYTQEGKVLTMKSMSSTLETNPEAYKLFKKAKSANVLAQILGGVGGGLIGYPIGTAVGGGDANWTIAAVGVGVLAIAIPISIGVNKKTKKAVSIYNSGLSKVSYSEYNTSYQIISNVNGIGVSMTF
ncbi:MAG TPA: hypothetical protein EYG92_02815 [Lutibacter sp.]|nr:hypothetical protein [Lutibacter sp.]